MKPGWKTTEFYLALAVVLPALIEGISALQEGKDLRAALLMVLSAVTSSAYAVVRTLAKKELADVAASVGSAEGGGGSPQVSAQSGEPASGGGDGKG